MPLSQSFSSSSLVLDSPTTHLAKLEKKQRDLVQVKEITAPVIKFHTTPQQITAKLLQLEERYVQAQGDPSDGRWGHISDFLRMRCTRQRRGNRYPLNKTLPDAKILIPPTAENPYIIAETEEEWLEWEKRREEDVKLQLMLRQKVSQWQEQVVKAKSESSSAKGKGKEKAKEEPVKEPARTQSQSQSQNSQKEQGVLGFKVVKGSSSKKLTAKPSNPQIGDVTLSSFSPPSFRASQVVTSTPLPHERPKTRPKLPIIERVEPLSPTPDEPPYPFSSQPLPTSQPLKRPRLEEDPGDAASKKAKLIDPITQWPPSSGPGRTTPPASSEATPNKAKAPLVTTVILPSTPKRSNPLPTLTEILSSRPKHSVTSTPRKQPQIRLDNPPSPDFTDHEEPLKDETEVRQLVNAPSSPAVSVRSFSMLAESDSSSSDHGSPPGSPAQPKDGFKAPAAVTKPGSLGDNFGMYSSQFDVEGYVGGVQELLSKDDIMFDMYIKDPGDE